MDTNYEIGDLRKKIAGELEEIHQDNKNKPVDVLTIREKYIYRAIRGHLLEEQVRYYLKTESERELVIDRENENMPYQIEIKIASEHCLVLQFHYPFRVQTHAIPAVAMEVAKINDDTDFGTYHLNVYTGDLSLKYKMDDIESFDGSVMWELLLKLCESGENQYYKLQRFSVGKYDNRIEEREHLQLYHDAISDITGVQHIRDYGVEGFNDTVIEKYLIEHMSRKTDDVKDEMLHQEPMNVDEDFKEPTEKMEVEKGEDSGKDLFDILEIDVADEETTTSGEKTKMDKRKVEAAENVIKTLVADISNGLYRAGNTETKIAGQIACKSRH